MDRLKAAFPPMPVSCDERVERTLREAQAMKMNKQSARKLSAALVFAIVLTLALAAAGVAAAKNMGLLEHIFEDRTPLDGTEKLLMTPGQTVEDDIFAFTLEEYIMDDNRLEMMFSVESR